MYGWRIRLGVILPLDNTVLEPEYYSLNLHKKGISCHILRLTSGNREKMLEQAEEMAKVSDAFDADILLYACAETSFFKGTKETQALENRLSIIANKPVISATSAALEALTNLNINRIVLITPYNQKRGRQLSDILENEGFSVVHQLHRLLDEESPNNKREWWGANTFQPSEVYRLCREALTQAVNSGMFPEAILVSATNLRTFEIIDTLEQDIKIPVITSNQALLWASLRKIGINDSFLLGRLFEHGIEK